MPILKVLSRFHPFVIFVFLLHLQLLMTDGRANNRINEIEKELRRLRDQLSRQDSEISAIREQYKISVEQKHNSDQKSKSAPVASLIESAPTNAQNPQPSTKDGIRGKISRKLLTILKWTGWTATLQTLGIIAGVVVAAATLLQFLDAHGNFRADQRAWVKIAFGWPSQLADGSGGIDTQLTNVGKSPVKRLQVHATMQVLDTYEEPSYDLVGFHSGTEISPLFPADTAPFEISMKDQSTGKSRSFSTTELDDLRSGRKYVAVVGYFAYWDQFDVHWERFCSWHYYGQTGTRVNSGSCVSWTLAGDGMKSMPFQKR
jgi:hypothetical protein